MLECHDIQPVFNEHKAIAYMCAYLSNSEESCSYAVKQALKISTENKDNNYEQMKGIAQEYASNRECSIQEAVYHCLPELWLRKVFPDVIFANGVIPENYFKILHSQQEISELPDEGEDVFKKNMLERYMDRPDEKFQNGKFASVNFLCYAEFLRYYYVSTISNENDWQSVELTDDMLETSLAIASHYTSVIPLMSSPEKLKCWKVNSILRYFTPNKNRYYEVYAHHLLILFYPFRAESDLKSDDNYTNKLAAPDVIDIVNRNRSIIEPYCELVDEALLRYKTEVINNDEIIEENSFLSNGVLVPCQFHEPEWHYRF